MMFASAALHCRAKWTGKYFKLHWNLFKGRLYIKVAVKITAKTECMTVKRQAYRDAKFKTKQKNEVTKTGNRPYFLTSFSNDPNGPPYCGVFTMPTLKSEAKQNTKKLFLVSQTLVQCACVFIFFLSHLCYVLLCALRRLSVFSLALSAAVSELV